MTTNSLEAARNAYVAQVLEWKQPQHPETEEYILALEDEVERLRSHAVSEKLLVQVSNGLNEVAPTTVNQDTIFVAEDLTEPPSAATTSGVHVNVEPESFFVTSSVESGEEFSGANIEKAIGSRHGAPSDINYRDSILSLTSQIELDLISEFMQRERTINSVIDGSITAVISVVNKERIRVVSQFAATLREKVSTGAGF